MESERQVQALSDAELLLRKDGLDKSLTACAMAGIEASASEQAEFALVQDEIARRGLASTVSSSSGIDWTSLLGLDFEGYRLTGFLAQGRFSFLMLGENQDGDRRVYKIARPQADAPSQDFDSNRWLTRAMDVTPFQVCDIYPPPAQMIDLQAERLSGFTSGAFVELLSVGNKDGLVYYSMPFLQGKTLRQYLQQFQPGVQDILKLFDLLALELVFDREGVFGMEERPEQYHGDITLDNIFLQGDFAADGTAPELTVKLLDPGYFGPLQMTDRYVENAMVGTPLYYPLLEADDIMAFGYCLWEAIGGRQPLLNPAGSNVEAGASILQTGLAEALEHLIQFRDSLGQPFLSALRSAALPSQAKPGVDRDIEAVILKMVRLAVDESGLLTIDKGYASFAEVEAALASIIPEIEPALGEVL